MNASQVTDACGCERANVGVVVLQQPKALRLYPSPVTIVIGTPKQGVADTGAVARCKGTLRIASFYRDDLMVRIHATPPTEE